MKSDIFSYMQQAVDIVGASEHDSNKIAATLTGTDLDGKPYAIAYNNYWPHNLKIKIGKDVKIGNSSGTVHAETACLLHAPVTDKSDLFVTDPPCPNCVKNMVEAGVQTLYIDHKGFDKDFATRRGEDFRTMSMEICRKAGIAVHKIFRKERRTEIIVDIPAGYKPVIEKRARIETVAAMDERDFLVLIEKEKAYYKERPFALALASGKDSGLSVISAEIHAVAGFTTKTASAEGKYDLLLQPVHRVLMTAAKNGLKLRDGYIFCSRVPTAREQVNLAGIGLSEIIIGDTHQARDENGLRALEQLSGAGILRVKSL